MVYHPRNCSQKMLAKTVQIPRRRPRQLRPVRPKVEPKVETKVETIVETKVEPNIAHPHTFIRELRQGCCECRRFCFWDNVQIDLHEGADSKFCFVIFHQSLNAAGC